MSAAVSNVTTLTSHLKSEGIRGDEIDSEGHQAVCDYIQREIVPSIDEDTLVPPFRVITYAIRAMIKPTLLVEEIPRLLLHLGHVEHIRASLMDGVREMRRIDRQINEHQAHRDDNKADFREQVEQVPLTEDERVYLRGILRADSDMRKAYRQAISQFSMLHAWDTWCSPNHLRLDALLKIYFPMNFGGDESVELESRYIFHQGLDDDERQALKHTADLLLDLLEQYPKGKIKKKKKRSHGRSSEVLLTKDALRIDVQDVVQSTLWYLNEMEHTIQRVESIFEDPLEG